MKKIFTLIAAMFIVAGALAQTEISISTGWNAKFVGFGKISFSNQYGEYKIAEGLKLTDYKGVKVTFDEDIKDCQILAAGSILVNDWKGNAPGAEGYNTSYETLYGDIVGGEASIDFSGFTAENTTVNKIEVQGTNAGAYCTVKSVKLIKADDTEEELTDGVGPVWGCTTSPSGTANVYFAAEYGPIVISASNLPTYESGKAYKIKLTYEEAPGSTNTAAQLPDGSPKEKDAQLNDYDKKYYIYGEGVTTGSTSCEVTINFEFTQLSFSAHADMAGKTLKNVKAYYEIVDDPTATGINNATATKSASVKKSLKNGQIVITRGDKAYNAVGQEL